MAACSPGRPTRPRRRSPQSQGAGPPLRGFRLAVVGPEPAESRYRAALQPLGAELFFAPSECKLNSVFRVCCKAHGILYITSCTSHCTRDHVTAAARRGIPLMQVHFNGSTRLRQAALDLAPDMESFRRERG